MIATFVRKSRSPICDMSTLHAKIQKADISRVKYTYSSMVIEPDVSSTIRNRASIKELLPAPVLEKEISHAASHFNADTNSPPDDSNFLATLNAERQPSQDQWQLWPVPHLDVFELDRALLGPLYGRLLARYFVRSLLRDVLSVAVVCNGLNGGHIVFHFGRLQTPFCQSMVLT